MITHTVTLTKHKRIPLDAFFLPSCDQCGPLLDAPTDIDAARDAKRLHLTRVQDEADGHTVGDMRVGGAI